MTIKLYTAATPNGYKASVALEEMELEYTTHALDLREREQKQDWFLKINPNGRIPAIEHDGFAVFESGAVLLYLARLSGKFYGTTEHERSRTEQWLMFQMGGIGPMMGQANVFYRYFPEKLQPAIDRYQGEGRRLFEVLDRRLGESEYLAGDGYTIADMANWCWVRTHKWSGIDRDGLDNLDRWMRAIETRPGVQRGVKVPYDVSERLREELGDEAARKFAEDARGMVEMGGKR